MDPITIWEGDDLGKGRVLDIVPAGYDLFAAYGITRKQFADAILSALEPLLRRPGHYLFHGED